MISAAAEAERVQGKLNAALRATGRDAQAIIESVHTLIAADRRAGDRVSVSNIRRAATETRQTDPRRAACECAAAARTGP